MTHRTQPSMAPLPAPLTALGFGAVTVAAQAGCLLLLALSQFGQQPLPQLPLAEIVFFGALFIAPVHALAQRLRTPWLLGAIALAVAGNAVLLALLLPLGGEARYLVAPAVALAAALGLHWLSPPRLGEMLAAMSVYIACTLLANYTFDAFIPVTELFGFAFPINVGTLFFGITFTQRDRVHRFGRSRVYAMIFAAAVANVLTALSLGTPLRYVAVGFLAIILSETADTEIYQRLLHRSWLRRVASSNAVSAPLDTVLFTVLAFAGEPFATLKWMLEVIVTDVVVKYASSMVAAIRLLAGGRAGKPEALQS